MSDKCTFKFSQWLADAAQKVGAQSAACVRMDSPVLRQRIAENKIRTGDWLKAGLHGEMDYLQRMFSEKYNPWKTFPFAKSVIVLTFTNRWGEVEATHPFPTPEKDALLGYISAYAKEVDYHTTGQNMLAELKAMLGEGVVAEATVDTKAVEERLLATVGGLGIIGSNGLLRVPGKINTRVFIGCLFVNLELPEVIREEAMPFGCEDCQACIKNCPTGAIKFAQPMDARACISYLTIEKRSLLLKEEAALMGNWIFGCDDCTNVCPPKDKEPTKIPVDLEWLLKTSSSEIRRTIKGNATSYAGVTQLRKNAVAVLKNMDSVQSLELLEWTRKNSGSDLIRQQIEL